MEGKKETFPDQTLRFVLDGVYYSLEQNQMSREVARAQLKQWFPDAEVLGEIPPAEEDDGS